MRSRSCCCIRTMPTKNVLNLEHTRNPDGSWHLNQTLGRPHEHVLCVVTTEACLRRVWHQSRTMSSACAVRMQQGNLRLTLVLVPRLDRSHRLGLGASLILHGMTCMPQCSVRYVAASRCRHGRKPDYSKLIPLVYAPLLPLRACPRTLLHPAGWHIDREMPFDFTTPDSWFSHETWPDHAHLLRSAARVKQKGASSDPRHCLWRSSAAGISTCRLRHEWRQHDLTCRERSVCC